MPDHLREAAQMMPATFLCASCGIEVRMEWAAPCFGLCEACEERVQQQPVSYAPVGNVLVSQPAAAGQALK